MTDFSPYILNSLLMAYRDKPHDFSFGNAVVWHVTNDLYITTRHNWSKHEFIYEHQYYWRVDEKGKSCGTLKGDDFHNFVAAKNKFLAERILLSEDHQ